VVSFDSRLPGTPASTWEADPRLHDRPRLDLEGIDEVLVIAAHPDDETLGAGGLIAECTARHIGVRVVVVTDGGAGGDAGRRAAELDAATAVLGASATHLGFGDGQTREQRADIQRALEPFIGALGPRALIVAPWRGDGHRDHRVVGELARELAGPHRLIEYPIWLWHWGEPRSEQVPWGDFVSLTIDAQTKGSALAAYESQLGGDRPVLRPDFLENFARDQELFVAGNRLLAPYFEAIHERRADPWGFQTRWYEQRKRDITIAALPDERYSRGLEIGCSIGVLTERLADRVDDLLAVDVSASAVDAARARLGPRARVEQLDLIESFPTGPFDLVVLSEVGYYFGRDGLGRVLDDIQAALSPDGVLLTCHWRHPVVDYPLTGDEVHELIREHELTITVEHFERDFVLGVFRRDARSVAERTGLA
jgi:LmbE family N-acetylglucosaminyl deacetylase